MSDGINERIGEDGQRPLLMIAEESGEAAPALIVVEEASPELPAPAVEALDSPKPETKKAKAAAATAAAAAPAIEIAEVPAVQAAPEPEPAAPAPSGASAPLPQPQQEEEAPVVTLRKRRKIDFKRHIPLAAVSMAVFASGLSVVGLLVASRTVAETKLVLEQVQAHQMTTRKLDKLIVEIDALHKREQIALTRLEQINAGKPATGPEVRAAIASLQLSMSKYQPGGSNGVLALIRDGQSELADRVSTMYRRLERLDEQIGKLTVSASPKAKTAADRGRTS